MDLKFPLKSKKNKIVKERKTKENANKFFLNKKFIISEKIPIKNKIKKYPKNLFLKKFL